jgi:hypothetical protein
VHVAKRCEECGALAVLIGNTEEGLISTSIPAAGQVRGPSSAFSPPLFRSLGCHGASHGPLWQAGHAIDHDARGHVLKLTEDIHTLTTYTHTHM